MTNLGNDISAEHEAVTAALLEVRTHILQQLNGLTDEQLRQTVLPSGWSILGLIRHLTLSDERYWFAVAIAGESLDYWPAEPGGDWLVADTESSGDVIRAYTDAIEHSERILAARTLDDRPAFRDAWWPETSFRTVRDIVQRVIIETATHAGHLDAVRELIDGRQYIVLGD